VGIIIGIDPGKAGGIAVVSTEASTCIDMPLLASGEIDSLGIFRFLAKLNAGKSFCILEKAQAMPQQGAVGTFNYGTGFGKIQAVLEILQIPYEEIRPQKWKKEFSLLKTEKKDSVAMAQKLFPSIEFITPRGRLLDGRAESCLMAEYGRRKKGV
jgi:crossover junction endodeoxyribonuclease RuvC